MPKLRVSRMLNLKQHSSLKTPRLLFSLFILSTLTLSGLALFKQTNPITHALDSNLSNGITVDSTLDTGDTSIGDGSCDDGGGHCTLRAAIQEANSNPDASTILFNITGTPSFTNNSQPGYTISPTSALPNITEQLTIDGYSQPGAEPNTAPAPQPLNGTLLVELDGGGAGGSNGLRFDPGSDSSAIRGLVIGGFANADGIQIGANNIQIQGNYLGTNPAGSAANPNQVGVNGTSSTPNGEDAFIGGLNPEERNIISGNTAGPTATGGYPGTGWVIQGNYVGVAADGTTAIPNASSAGAGALSIDNCSDVIVGGTQPGAANVLSGNTKYGLAPHNSPGLVVQGNYIGTDWTGQIAVPNNAAGIIISGDQTGSIIGGTTSSARNVISGNTIAGIIDGATEHLQIQGNYIGLDMDGEDAIANGSGILEAGNAVIGGSEAGRNVISGNTLFNISVQALQTPNSGVEVSGNYIGTNASGNIDPSITALQGEGVRVSANTSGNIIGGTVGNLIAGNRGAGVSVRSLTITQFGITATPTKNAILGNRIYGNEAGGPLTGSPGLGIDHYRATVASLGGFPADLQADSYVDLGVNTNDMTDSDTGPNNYINFPTLNSVTQDGTTATINFNLDASDSPTNQYRIEFFSNDTADPSGYGEGQTFLGSTTVTNGNNQLATLSLPSNLNLSSKSISATTTAIDNTTNSGFGSTSEFSPIVLASVTTPTTTSNQGSNSSSLASTGNSSLTLILLATILVIGGGLVTYKLKFSGKK